MMYRMLYKQNKSLKFLKTLTLVFYFASNPSHAQPSSKQANGFGYTQHAQVNALELTKVDPLQHWKALQQQSYDSAKAGKLAISLTQANKALTVANTYFSENNSNTSTTLAHLGKLYVSLDNFPQAKHYYKQSLQIETFIANKSNQQHPELARAQLGLGMVYNQERNGNEALPLIKNAFMTLQRHGFFEKNLSNKAQVLFELGKANYLVGNITKAKGLYEQSLTLRESLYGSQHLKVADTLNELAMMHYKLAQYTQAEQLLEKSLAISQKTYGNNHPETYVLMNNMLRLYEKSGNTQKAKTTCQQLHTIWKKNAGFPEPECQLGR